MLLSVLKVLFFFAVVLAVSLGAMRLAESGQSLRLEFGGTEFMLGPVQVIVAVVVLMIAAWLAIKLLGLMLAFLRFLAGDETAISRYFARSRQRKGYEALGEGMLAVASGEGRLALDKAAQAERYLDQPHITNLLVAQAAEVAGDSARAGQVYRKLLEDNRTRFVGVRGLMRQKLAEGDTHAALQLAQKAYALKPRHVEVQNTLLELQTREGDWKGARGILKDKRKLGELPKEVHIRRDAVLALQEASEVLAQGSSISAREAAISANRASPDLIPAAVLAARSYTAQKDFRNATRVLEKTWSVRPHPDIAAAFAEIVPDETPAARLKRFDALIRKNPDNEESRLLHAELLLAAEDFPGARRALGDLAETHPTVRTLSIMAAVERGEGADDAVVRGWLARALTASRGPQWCCDTCQNVMAVWAPVCDSCGGFDTLSWREPEHRRSGAMATGAEMLPLLVGPSTATTPADAALDAQVVNGADLADATVRSGQAGREVTSTPGLTTTPVETAPHPAARVTPPQADVTNVAPGMVPREDDYNNGAPSATVTTPEETERPAPTRKPTSEPLPEPPSTRPEKAGGAMLDDQMPEPHPVRTAEFDIPADEDEKASSKSLLSALDAVRGRRG